MTDLTNTPQHRRAALVRAVQAAYPGASALHVTVAADDNNPGYCYPVTWQVATGEQRGPETEVDAGPFDQQLNDYVDEQRLRTDFTLDLTNG